MGCASSKKRTTSIDDLTGQKNEPLTGKSPNKNGQLSSANDAKHSKSKSGDSSKAMQIPGTHNSFMAPDGIPFIDEDVDDDAEMTGGNATVTVGNATTNKSDVNKNVVGDVDAPSVVVADQPRPTSGGTSTSVEEEKKQAVAAEIMKREMEITHGGSDTVQVQQVVVTTTDTSPGTNEQHTTTHVVNGVGEPSDVDQEKAAVRIQAGIRGYRDRQRVKALRASQQTPHQQHQINVVNGEANDDSGDLQVTTSNDEDMSHTPEMNDAAVKIQANYKGYKTRKQMGKI